MLLPCSHYLIMQFDIQIPTFYNFRIWKGFKVWQLGIRRRKYLASRKYIGENLCQAIIPLGKALLSLRAEYCRFMDMSFVDVSQRENHHLFYFIEAQMLTFETVRDALIDFRHRMTSVLCKYNMWSIGIVFKCILNMILNR